MQKLLIQTKKKHQQNLKKRHSHNYQLKQTLGLLGDPSWVVRRVRPDGLKQLILIVALER